MHCKLIFWLTLVDVSDQQEVSQCYIFILSSSVLQHCGRRRTTFQRNRLPPLFGFRVSLKSTVKTEAVRFSERLVPTIRLHHNIVTHNTTITTYAESEKLEACKVKRKYSWLPDVMLCCWVNRSWHFEGNDQPKSKSKQYTSWTAWTLELLALHTFPDLHNRYIPECPAQVWTVNSKRTYKGAQLKSKLQHPRTWSTAVR